MQLQLFSPDKVVQHPPYLCPRCLHKYLTASYYYGSLFEVKCTSCGWESS